MKILAVSDQESTTLLHWIEQGEPTLAKIDLIVSCGDLSSAYLEYIETALGKRAVYVKGNHDINPEKRMERFSEIKSPLRGFLYEEKIEEFNGLENIHARIFVFLDWVIVGFEGSLWYNGEGPQYTEEEMFRVVRQIERRLTIRKMTDFFKGEKSKKLLVISHAAPMGIHDGEDLCHRGFNSFHHLIKQFSPSFWIHGHTSTNALTQNQLTEIGQTIILNAYEYKFISLEQGCPPRVSYKPSILI